jgi:NTE family protein
LYAEGDLQAIYSRQRLGAGFDVGWILGRTGQLRAGYETAYVRNVTRVGEEIPDNRGSEQAARVRLNYDGQDRAYFPTRGLRVTATASWMFKAPDAVRDFGKVEGGASAAFRLSRRHHFSLSAEGGATVQGTAPTLYQFSLGGPFRLSAFPPNAFRGPHFVLGRLAYRTAVGRLPPLLGDRLYVTGIIEAGSAFDRPGDAMFKTSFTGGLVTDTFFGPFFAGASVGSGGDVRVYFLVGALVR